MAYYVFKPCFVFIHHAFIQSFIRVSSYPLPLLHGSSTAFLSHPVNAWPKQGRGGAEGGPKGLATKPELQRVSRNRSS